jgi:type II secretory pathway pseudopilin PulG
VIKLRKFTLIEVVVALTILTLGLSVSLALATTAKNRIIRARERWKEQHALEQAAEYYLLTPGEGNIDVRIFPYEEYYAECRVEPCEDNFPDGVDNIAGSWKLATVKIKVLSREDSHVLKEVQVDTIMKDLDL